MLRKGINGANVALDAVLLEPRLRIVLAEHVNAPAGKCRAQNAVNLLRASLALCVSGQTVNICRNLRGGRGAVVLLEIGLNERIEILNVLLERHGIARLAGLGRERRENLLELLAARRGVNARVGETIGKGIGVGKDGGNKLGAGGGVIESSHF